LQRSIDDPLFPNRKWFTRHALAGFTRNIGTFEENKAVIRLLARGMEATNRKAKCKLYDPALCSSFSLLINLCLAMSFGYIFL
jgi:hypothetical protein